MAKQKNEDYFPEKTREMLQEIYSNLDINDIEKNLKEECMNTTGKIYEKLQDGVTLLKIVIID